MSRVLRIEAIAALAVATALARPSAAEPERRVRLEYDRTAEAERCPEPAELGQSVAAELGYDPFDSQAEQTLAVSISRNEGELVARITLRDGGGEALGERELASPADDCRELAQALALAVAIAVDPVRATRQSAPEEPDAAETPPPPAPVIVVSPAPPPQADQRRSEGSPSAKARLAGGALIASGTAPALATGIWIQGGARLSMLSLALEGQAHLPASKPINGGSVSSSLLLASALACLHADALFGCAVGSAGALQGTGEGVSDPRNASTFFARAGGRVGIDVPLDETFALVVHADVAGNLTRTTLSLDGRQAWTTPPISGLLAGGLRAEF